MRIVYLGDRPPPVCDPCPNPKLPARFNSPTRRDSAGAGSWANMCDRHMDSMGVMTSVTEKFVTGDKP
jgi:hypothetical protein